MTKNDILKALDNMGFTVEEFGGHFYHFEYEGVHYLYNHDDSDEDFLHISIPDIFEVSEETADLVMPVINRTNNIVKYAKIIHAQDMVWATFEYPLFEWVDLEELLEFAIKLLQGAAITFNHVLRGEYDEKDGEEDAA